MLAFRCHYFLKYGSHRWMNASDALRRVRDVLQREVVVNPMRAQHLKLIRWSEFTGSTAEQLSTSAMPAISSSDMLPGKDRDFSSDYDEALFLLKTNTPEQRLDIPLPYSQYLKLEECWSKFKSAKKFSEKRYPSLSYNSLMQIATVVTTQSALHDYTAAVFREIIASSVNEYLSIHEPRAIHRIKNYGSTTMDEPSFYGRTSKEPDQSFGYGGPGREPQMQVAIECGFSENYKALCRDKDLWIQQLGAKAVILICLNESPRYKSPRTAYENIEDAATAVKNMVKYVAKAMANVLEQGNYGPIEYRSHIWVGKLDEVFVEVWRADGQQPVRKWLIRHGHPNPLPRTIGLKISDFFPENEWTACKIPDSDVRFHAGRYLFEDIMEAMKLTVKARFVRFLTSKKA
ncbi:hypothetical protein V1505DRAFT_381642 [Lipomyces doorenjongii]